MGLKNMLSIFCFLFIAVACSVEDDIMNDVDKEVQSTSEVYASLGVSLAADGIQTKSTVYNEDDKDKAPNGINGEGTVNNCYIAVFDNETKTLLASRLYTGKEVAPSSNESNLYTLGKSLVFKISEKQEERHDLLLVAVAQMNEYKEGSDEGYKEISSISQGIQNCQTYSSLMNFTLREDPTVLVKVGELLVNSSEYDDYMNITSSMVDKEGNALTGKKAIRIEVEQRSAAVKLEKFDVISELGTVADVKVMSLQLLNMVGSAKVGKYDEKLVPENSETRTIEDGDGEYIIHRDNLFNERFYTYEYPSNIQGDRTKLRIAYTYQLNGKEEKGFSEITIKSPGKNDDESVAEVRANHLYKLTVTVKNGVATATIICSTKDWVEGGVIEVPVQK